VIDPYKPPRIQRMVPWRTSHLLAEAKRREILDQARELAAKICPHIQQPVVLDTGEDHHHDSH
jgi:hypothetical protein